MGSLDALDIPNLGAMPRIEIKPRVFVRKLGGDYLEIADIKSFERRDDEGASGIISFVMGDPQEAALTDLLRSGSDKFVDVRMEMLIGMLMVTTFSGFVEDFSGNSVSFSLSTAVSTDVVDVAQ